MITKFNTYRYTYIKESDDVQDNLKEDIEHYIKDLLPEKNNIFIGFNKMYNPYDFTVIQDIQVSVVFKDITGSHMLNSKELIFKIDKNNDIYKFLNRIDYETKDINKLKEHIKTFFENYYNEFHYNEFDNISKVPVLDVEMYNDFIMNFIERKPQQIKWFRTIKEYLTEDNLEELKHLTNANNFDLI